MIARPLCLLLTLCLVIVLPLRAQEVIPLYEGKAPGSESWTWSEQVRSQNPFNTRIVYNVSRPTLTAYLPAPEKATGTAIIVAPGGAFHILSVDNEGVHVAQWLNERGIAAFVLKYRLVRSVTDNPVAELVQKMADFDELDRVNAPVVELALKDGAQAVGHVRDHAAKYNIDPQRIGFMGFSAGATLTMSVVYSAAVDRRPNFVAPIYAYERAILGERVPEERTPIFVAAASDDGLGLAPHSVNIYSKWLAAGQPAELHMYERGGHGFGMRKQNLPSDHWIDAFEDWLLAQGFTVNTGK